MDGLTTTQDARLRALLAALIDQEAARVLVSPHQNAAGFWFGGGSLVQDQDGTIWLSGRYRDYGDSRTGLQAGQRGLECALYRSGDGGQTFQKVRAWSKADLTRDGRTVLSIEGTALYRHHGGTWELFVSSEKALAYPASLGDYQKPGTGVWTIDCMTGPSPEALDRAVLTPVLESLQPAYLHVKDPVVLDRADGGTTMIFCSHSFCWSSTNTGLATRVPGQRAFRVQLWEMVHRGATWDVAATRITDRMPVPQVGCFAGQRAASIYFYDGAECLRLHDENPMARTRPRGYSCEELGGAFWGWDDAFPVLHRLSPLAPIFVSPRGTGCSRYVGTLVSADGILVTWQQGQADGSQPLVGHFLPTAEVERILAGK